MKLDSQFIEGRNQALLEAKKGIESELAELGKMPDMGQDSDSFEEETDEAEEYVTNLSKAEVLQRDLDEINEAIKKMEQGSFGTCDICKKAISKEILLIAPESRYCKACKLARPYRKTAV